MEIRLKASGKKSTGNSIRLQTNNSGSSSSTTTTATTAAEVASARNAFHVLDEDDHENDNRNNPIGGECIGSRTQQYQSRSRVNRHLQREQALLRHQQEIHQPPTVQPTSTTATTSRTPADSAAAAAISDVLYDYDGSYDTFASQRIRHQDEKYGSHQSNTDQRKKSLYMEDLIKAAEERQKEHELRIERKIAAEQVTNDIDGGELYSEKDKFVTSAYKRKLQERDMWQRDQSRRVQEEKQADVTKRENSGLAMAQFYSKFNQNVAMGGKDANMNTTIPPVVEHETNVRNDSFVNESERVSSSISSNVSKSLVLNKIPSMQHSVSGHSVDAKLDSNGQSPRLLTERKITKARQRYFLRHSERQKVRFNH